MKVPSVKMNQALESVHSRIKRDETTSCMVLSPGKEMPDVVLHSG